MSNSDNTAPKRAAEQQEDPKDSGKPEATGEEVAHAHDGAVPEERVEEARAHDEARAKRAD